MQYKDYFILIFKNGGYYTPFRPFHRSLGKEIATMVTFYCILNRAYLFAVTDGYSTVKHTTSVPCALWDIWAIGISNK